MILYRMINNTAQQAFACSFVQGLVFLPQNRLVMTFDRLVMQGILPLENKTAIVKPTRKLSKKSPAGEK